LDANLQSTVSLKLDDISLQSLGWILKSIKADHMTPSEKLILSRIKVKNINRIMKGMLRIQTQLKGLGKNAADTEKIIVH